MTRRILTIFLLLISLTAPCAAAEPQHPLEMVILYDSENRFGDLHPALTAMREFLGHYNANQRAVHLSDWTAGTLSGADVVVFLGLNDEELPREMLAEIASAPKVMWIESGIDQMARFLGWDDFDFKGPRSGWTTISYRGLERPLDNWIRCYVTEPGGERQIFSTMSDTFETHPYAWQRDNIYYISSLSLIEPFSMAGFVDFMGHVFPEEYVIEEATSKKVMIRIEDVSPLVAADAVRGVIEAVESYGVPYAIAVVPIGLMEKSHLTLRDNPELLAVLQMAQANGASIIMHGYTHQNEFSPTTGEGWEFWNARDDLPMENDAAFTRDRIEKSFIEMARNGLYPVAFEPPHYAMSSQGYVVLSEYFELFSGMPQVSDKSYMIGLTLPFVVRSQHLNGMLVLPENLGYYDGDEFTVEAILQNSRDLLDIKDSFACFFYHGYLPADRVHFIIEGLRSQGYEFFDVRSLNVKAGSSQIKISVEDGELLTWVDPTLTAKWEAENSRVEKRTAIEKMGWVQVTMLGSVILIFLILIFRLRRNANRKYEVE